MDDRVTKVGVTRIDDLKIAYESAGEGEPAVVLIHGAFEDRTYFASQIAHLAVRHRVLVLDLRGHGESDVPEKVSIEDFAADVTAVADAAGLGSAVLCGHSMGGAVALMVAGLRPDLVRAIVMLDGSILFPEPLRRQALENLVPALEGDHWLDAMRSYFSRTLDPKDPPEVTARVMHDLGLTRPGIASSFFRSLFGSDYADALKTFRRPLLYVHAKAPSDLQRLVELCPSATVRQVNDSGHYVMLSAPAQVNAALDRFLDSLAAEPLS